MWNPKNTHNGSTLYLQDGFPSSTLCQKISKIAFVIGGKLKLGSVDKRTFSKEINIKVRIIPAD
jgi:hypothetical protein